MDPHRKSRIATWIWPLAIFLLTVSLRVAYLILSGEFGPSAGTGAEMERAAAALATKGYLGDVFPGVEGPSAHVAPLYPFIVAGIYKVFGVASMGATVAQSALAILATALALSLLPLAGERLGLGRVTGIMAGLFLAVAPLNLWVETSGSWEQPLAALALLGLLLGFASVSKEGWHMRPLVFALGVLMGLTALLNPGLLPAAALIMGGEFLARRGARLQVVRASLVMCLVAGAIMAPWIVRNYRVFGQFIPVRGNLGLELALGNHDEANGKSFAVAWDNVDDPSQRLHPFASASEQARLRELGEALYMKEKLHTATTWIRQNPGRFLHLTLNRFRIFWFPGTDSWAPSSRARLFKSLVLSGMSLFALAGLILLWVGGHPFRIHLTGTLVGPSLIYLVSHVGPRYSYPVLGVSALLGAYVLVALARRFLPQYLSPGHTVTFRT